MDPFVGEIRAVPFNFAPKGWAFCNGQILPIQQNTALFSLLGTTYGGDGKSTFALPDLQGRVPMHPGQGPGLSLHDLGETGGSDTVTLLATQIPPHTHSVAINSSNATTATPSASASLAAPVDINGDNANAYSANANNDVINTLSARANSGNGHNNLSPYLTLNYIIALQGVFPPRS